MHSAIYYHVLEIGFLYEKGNRTGTKWRPGEKRRLQDDCAFWKKLIAYGMQEKCGVDRSEKLFSDLEALCTKALRGMYELGGTPPSLLKVSWNMPGGSRRSRGPFGYLE